MKHELFTWTALFRAGLILININIKQKFSISCLLGYRVNYSLLSKPSLPIIIKIIIINKKINIKINLNFVRLRME